MPVLFHSSKSIAKVVPAWHEQETCIPLDFALDSERRSGDGSRIRGAAHFESEHVARTTRTHAATFEQLTFVCINRAAPGLLDELEHLAVRIPAEQDADPSPRVLSPAGLPLEGKCNRHRVPVARSKTASRSGASAQRRNMPR